MSCLKPSMTFSVSPRRPFSAKTSNKLLHYTKISVKRWKEGDYEEDEWLEISLELPLSKFCSTVPSRIAVAPNYTEIILKHQSFSWRSWQHHLPVLHVDISFSDTNRVIWSGLPEKRPSNPEVLSFTLKVGFSMKDLSLALSLFFELKAWATCSKSFSNFSRVFESFWRAAT